jgi:2-polyprenyl-3-methyl-5-hydroxy-6-metoxy-1,4-benzoquinol methylase
VSDVTCRLCGSPEVTLRIPLEGYSVYRCRACTGVFTDLPADAIDGLYGEEYFSEEFGPYFAALFGDTDDGPLRRHFARYVDALERNVAGRRVLDVGCAAGLFLDVARERGWKVEGVEVSEHAAAVAQERRHIPVRVGDVAKLDLPRHAYDAVTLMDALEHIAEPGALLDRLRELIAPGGALMLVLPNDRNLTTLLAMTLYRLTFHRVVYPASRVHQIYHVTYFTPRTIAALLERHGFEVVEVAPDETVRGLLNESPLMRAAVGAVFGLARVLRLQNKMVVVARPKAERP